MNNTRQIIPTTCTDYVLVHQRTLVANSLAMEVALSLLSTKVRKDREKISDDIWEEVEIQVNSLSAKDIDIYVEGIVDKSAAIVEVKLPSDESD